MATSTQCILALTLKCHMFMSCIPPSELEGMAHASTHHPNSSLNTSTIIWMTSSLTHTHHLKYNSLSSLLCWRRDCSPNISYTHLYGAITLPFPTTSWNHTWIYPTKFIATIGVMSLDLMWL
jgi:hypothetical protein